MGLIVRVEAFAAVSDRNHQLVAGLTERHDRETGLGVLRDVNQHFADRTEENGADAFLKGKIPFLALDANLHPVSLLYVFGKPSKCRTQAHLAQYDGAQFI